MTTSFDHKIPSSQVLLGDRHKELADHQQMAFLENLKKFLLSHESVNKWGLTFLQQAAREGMMEVSLRLLQRGAYLTPKSLSDKEFQNPDIDAVKVGTRKSPYVFAQERGHFLIAEMLAACTSNHAADKNIRNAILFWLIEKDTRDSALRFWEPKVLENPASVADTKTPLLSDEKNIAVITQETLSRFIEFAAFCNNTKLVSSLLKVGKLKNDSTQQSAGYWAAINNDSKERTKFSFYDSLIIAAALKTGCKFLYSEDLQSNQNISGLTIKNPF